MPHAPALGFTRSGGCVVLIAALLMLSGCNIVGYAASTFQDRTVKAQHRLAAQRTLVLVEDPRDLLGPPTLPAIIARNIDHHLVANKALGTQDKGVDPSSLIIPQRELHALQSRLGQSFATTPVDQIAKLLDAQQVIYVLVEQADYRMGMAMAQPQATVQVRVLDIVNRRRVFPPAHEFEAHAPAGTASTPGLRVTSQLRPTRVHEGHRAERVALEQALAARIAEDVARLFYDWQAPETGRQFE